MFKASLHQQLGLDKALFRFAKLRSILASQHPLVFSRLTRPGVFAYIE